MIHETGSGLPHQVYRGHHHYLLDLALIRGYSKFHEYLPLMEVVPEVVLFEPRSAEVIRRYFRRFITKP